MLDTSEMDRLITLQQQTYTRSATGQEQIAWVSVAPPVWAKYIPGHGREYHAGDQIIAEVDAIFRIRYREFMNPKWQIVYGLQTYEILAITEIERREGLEIATRILRIK